MKRSNFVLEINWQYSVFLLTSLAKVQAMLIKHSTIITIVTHSHNALNTLNYSTNMHEIVIQWVVPQITLSGRFMPLKHSPQLILIPMSRSCNYSKARIIYKP